MTTTPTSHTDETPESTQSESSGPLSAAKSPVGVGAISVVGPLLALALLGVGIVLVRDALVWFGVVSGRAWTQQLGAGLNGLTPVTVIAPIAVLAVILGLVLLVVGLRRRPRTGVAVDASTGVFLRTGDVARLARDAAEQVDGVLEARTTASRRTVEVRVTGSGADVSTAVERAVTRRLQALATQPDVKVTMQGGRS